MDKSWMHNKYVRIALSIAPLLVVGGLGYYLWDAGLLDKAHDYIEQHTSLPLFLALLLTLPVFGFPLSLLLVVAGARLGIVWGITALVVATPVHLFLTWLLSRWLQRWITNFLKRKGHSLPQIPERDQGLWVAMFSLIPALSYAVKNFTITLGGGSLGLILAVAWPVQVAQGIPLVLVGGSVATGSLTPLFIGIFLLLLAMVGTPRIVRSLRSNEDDAAQKSNKGSDSKQ